MAAGSPKIAHKSCATLLPRAGTAAFGKIWPESTNLSKIGRLRPKASSCRPKSRQKSPSTTKTGRHRSRIAQQQKPSDLGPKFDRHVKLERARRGKILPRKMSAPHRGAFPGRGVLRQLPAMLVNQSGVAWHHAAQAQHLATNASVLTTHRSFFVELVAPHLVPGGATPGDAAASGRICVSVPRGGADTNVVRPNLSRDPARC